MSEKTRSSAAAHAQTPVGQTPWNIWTDISRQQMAKAAESACAIFRGMEAIRAVQQDTAHQALEQYQAAAQKMRAATEPSDLLSIQSGLLRFDVQGAMQYWQQLGNSVLKTQMELLSGGMQMLPPSSEDPFTPVIQAWQNAVAHPFDSTSYSTATH